MRWMLLLGALALSACNAAPPFKPANIQGASGNYMDDYYSYGTRASIPDTARGMVITPADLINQPKSWTSSQ